MTARVNNSLPGGFGATQKKAPTEAGALYDCETSIHRLTLPRLLPLDLLRRRQNALPILLAIQAGHGCCLRSHIRLFLHPLNTLDQLRNSPPD